MTYKLKDLADVIRSKNAGPYELTFDIMFKTEEIYKAVVASGAINKSSFATLYNIAPESVMEIIHFHPAKAIKVTIARPVSSGDLHETDVYGAQQHAPLMGFSLDLGAQPILCNMDDTKNTQLKIEADLLNALSGNRLKNALDFIAHIKASGMTPHAENQAAFEYKGEWVCIICIIPMDGEPGWVIFDNPLTSKYDDFPVDSNLKEFAWVHVNICTSCGGGSGCGSQPGRRKTIFGKTFDNVCTSEVAFWNPDEDALCSIMQMINIWKESVD